MKIYRIGAILACAWIAAVCAVLWMPRLPAEALPPAARIGLAVLLPLALAGVAIVRELAPLGALREPLQALAAPAQSASPVPAPPGPRPLARELQANLERVRTRLQGLERDHLTSMAESRLLEFACNKMQVVLQCLPDGVLILDPAGEVTFASEKIEPLLGVPVREVVGQPLEGWCTDSCLLALLTAVRNGSPDARRRSTVEFDPARVPDRHLSATIQPLLGGASGLMFGSLVVLRDATGERLARQAASDFVAHVSHELKSPLNVIAMYCETLADPDAGDAPRIDAVNVIQDEVERMVNLVNNLLNVSKIETGAMRPERHHIKLDELMRDCLQLAQPRAAAHQVRLDLRVPRELAAVSADKDLLRIALNNLLSNAIKYNRAGGSVTLMAEEDEHDVVVSVRDTGIGMAPDAQARVTEKFYRVPETGPEQRGGHGLGLYLASQIVELHHGRLRIESEPERGSTFSIHLQKTPALEGANVI